MLIPTGAIVVAVLGAISQVLPELVFFDLLTGLGTLLFLPLEMIPVGRIIAVLPDFPPTSSFLTLFLVGTLLLGLVELS